jgi:hypothetical protein
MSYSDNLGGTQGQDKNDLIKKLQLAQKQNYDRKKMSMLGGTGTGTGGIRKTNLGANGKLTLEQMDLDRKDDDSHQ